MNNQTTTPVSTPAYTAECSPARLLWYAGNEIRLLELIARLDPFQYQLEVGHA